MGMMRKNICRDELGLNRSNTTEQKKKDYLLRRVLDRTSELTGDGTCDGGCAA
jgi:hypothetical protein